MSPFEINLLLHYYAICGDIENFERRLVQETLERFEIIGLVRKTPSEYASRKWELTDCGRAYVNKLCNVPIFPLDC